MSPFHFWVGCLTICSLALLGGTCMTVHASCYRTRWATIRWSLFSLLAVFGLLSLLLGL